MATLGDIGVSALINTLSAFALEFNPSMTEFNGARSSPRRSRNFVGKFVNLEFKTYLTFLNWMTESEIINHAGLDSAVFLRIYTFGLKIFVPMMALLVLIPVNVSSGTLFLLRKELVVSDIDKLSISNVRPNP